MPNRTPHGFARVASWLAWVLTLALGVGGVAVSLVDTRHSGSSDISGAVTALLSFQLMSTIGVLIVRREPRNAIGWIFSAAAFLLACGSFGAAYSQYALGTTPAPVPGGAVATVLNGGYLMGLTLFVSFVMLLFPDGNVPGRRWRPAAWFAGLALTLLWLGMIFGPGVLDAPRPVDNPFGVEGAQYLLAAGFALPVIIGLGIAAGVTRYRHGNQQSRQQQKWFVSAVCATALFFLVSLPIQARTGYHVTDLTVLGVFVLIPVSVGIAILRYRLYEIDVIIRKTLVYAALAATLALLYLGGISLIGWLFRSVSGQSGTLAVTLSTLVVAVAFQPLRHRIQRAVDHRFYRRKYDSAHTLETFSGRLREQIDLDALHAEVLTVVTDTVQPRHANLWLRPAKPRLP